MQELVQHRQHKQNEGSGGQHASHDDPGQRLLRLCADTTRDGRRQEPDGRRQRSHQHRTHPDLGAFQDGLFHLIPFTQHLSHTTDEDQRSLHGYAEQRNETHRRGDTEMRSRRQ